MRSNSQFKKNSDYKKLANDLGFNLNIEGITAKNINNNLKNNNKKTEENIKNLNLVGINRKYTNSININTNFKINTNIKNIKNTSPNNLRNNINLNKNTSPRNLSNNINLNKNSLPLQIKPLNTVTKPIIIKNDQKILINNRLNTLTNNENKKVIPTKINNINKNSFSNNFNTKPKNNKPSDKYTKIKSSDPFATDKKHKTNFGYVYSAGGIPCRIQHGSVKLKLKWDILPEKYDPILIVCFEGLLESEHPYNFAASQCIKEMLQSPGAFDKVNPILNKIFNPLRAAFASINNFEDTIEITRMLSDLVKDNLNSYLHFFLQQINKRASEIKYKEKVFDLLRILESNGGEDALKEIKKKIPTYVSLV